MNTRLFLLLCGFALITTATASVVISMNQNTTTIQSMDNLAYCQKYLKEPLHYLDSSHRPMREVCSILLYQDADWTKQTSIIETDQLFERRISLFYYGVLWLLVVYLYLTFE